MGPSSCSATGPIGAVGQHRTDVNRRATGDTDTPPGCEGPADGSDQGVDESGSSGGSMLDPFGDVDALVTCASPTKCAIEPELFAAVERNFAVFHDEGIRLEPVSIPMLGKGIQLSGFDRGEASYDLLTALGFQDGDVLTHIDGASLLSSATIEQLMLDLTSTAAWSLTIRRRTGSTWLTLDHTLTRAP